MADNDLQSIFDAVRDQNTVDLKKHISLGHKVNQKEKNSGVTALHLAVAKGDLE